MSRFNITVSDVEDVKVRRAALWRNGRASEIEMAYLYLDFGGGSELCIDFVSWEAMIAFCEKHNFPYEDKRL